MRRSFAFVVAIVLAAVLISSAAAGSFAAAGGAVAAPWKNCTQVNKKYPHGVGKVGARDHTTSTPVTAFKRSNALYRTAMNNNKNLDRDKDGIACESA